MATEDFTGTQVRADHAGTAPLPALAVEALARLERAFAPAPTVLMSFPTRAKAVVTVTSVDTGRTPYEWSCSAGHSGDEAYAVLSFCRDDAKAHASTCRGAEVDLEVLRRVHAALGFKRIASPRAYLGETATRMQVWSQVELNEIFERVGGSVASRQVERSTSDGSATWTATELTLTMQVDGVGPVEIVTDIEDDPENGYRTDLPVVAVARYTAASAHCRELAAGGDYDGCWPLQDEMAMCRCQLEQAGRLDLIGGAA